VSKYADHIARPRFMPIRASTWIADWVGHAAWHLRDEAQGVAQAVRGRNHRRPYQSRPWPYQDGQPLAMRPMTAPGVGRIHQVLPMLRARS
jgi:hypothetical protein